jgi:phosphoadenosine phosphosulfate reductase
MLERTMSSVEELFDSVHDLTAQELLRFLITDKFPGKTLVSASLRGRSVVLLQMIAEIDPSTPIVFCHAPNSHPDSQEFRARLVARLGLRDIRDPASDESGPLPGDCDHSEGLWAEDPVDHKRVYATTYLNQTLAEFDCWVSGVYHGPYSEDPAPRVIEEGRLIRIDPLAGWSQDDVRQFMKEHGLSYHPRATLPRGKPATEAPSTVPTYHF